MSGRLIILPKKSWHVGRRENIEKVLRDERMAAEGAATANERSREITQEGIVEQLLAKRSKNEGAQNQAHAGHELTDRNWKRQAGTTGRRAEIEDRQALGGKGQGWGRSTEHVNLFSQEEQEAEKSLGQNVEYEREKKEQELLAQQRTGLAPTVFGEGSAELTKNRQPWYKYVASPSGESKAGASAIRLGREVVRHEAEAVLKRDQGRKALGDPMGSLFRSAAQPDSMGNARIKMSSETDEALCSSLITGKFDEESRSEPSVERRHRGERHKDKKRGKKRKNKTESSKRKSSRRCPRKASGSKSDSDQDASRESDDTRPYLEELRRKRLAREGGERAREIRLLAEREMTGQAVPNERRIAYNNQFNTLSARQNKPRGRDHRR